MCLGFMLEGCLGCISYNPSIFSTFSWENQLANEGLMMFSVRGCTSQLYNVGVRCGLLESNSVLEDLDSTLTDNGHLV
jgi:hypothetical protein